MAPHEAQRSSPLALPLNRLDIDAGFVGANDDVMAVDASAQSAVAVNVGEVNVQSDDGIAAFLENAFLQIENSLFARLVNGFFNLCGIGEYQGVAGVEYCSAGEKPNVTRDFCSPQSFVWRCGGTRDGCVHFGFCSESCFSFDLFFGGALFLRQDAAVGAVINAVDCVFIERVNFLLRI